MALVKRPHLPLERVVFDEEETLGEQDLQFLDKDVLCVVDTDQELNDVTPFAFSEICRREPWSVRGRIKSRRQRTKWSIDRIRGPLRVVEVLRLVPRVLEWPRVGGDEFGDELVPFLNQGRHDAPDRIFSGSQSTSLYSASARNGEGRQRLTEGTAGSGPRRD